MDDNYRIPYEVQYPIEDIIKFIRKDPEPIILFYGGEPLLRINLLTKVIDSIKATYVLQTNGLFLDKIPKKYLNLIDTILVSIDGRERITDLYRGKGTYSKIINNIIKIRNNAFTGDLIARMTVSNYTDIFEDVNHLVNLTNPHFDHVHWQLDVIWSDIAKYGDFSSWVKKYNLGISKLIRKWKRLMLTDGLVQGIVPFLGIMNTLLSGKSTKLRCGSGLNAFAIQTNGDIYACPVCPEFEDFKVGNIYKSNPTDLENSLLIGTPCTECEILDICGGRCLFANKHHLDWGVEGFNEVCKTVKHLVLELQRIVPIIKALITEGVLTDQHFAYPPFNNSCEIIP